MQRRTRHEPDMGLGAKEIIFDTTVYVTPTAKHHDLLH
jgi:hypothetical protein